MAVYEMVSSITMHTFNQLLLFQIVYGGVWHSKLDDNVHFQSAVIFFIF